MKRTLSYTQQSIVDAVKKGGPFQVKLATLKATRNGQPVMFNGHTPNTTSYVKAQKLGFITLTYLEDIDSWQVGYTGKEGV